MAEKKTHTFVEAEIKAEISAEKATEKKAGGKKVTEAKPVGNATGKRVLAIVFWVLALACEICAICVLTGKLSMHFMPTLYQLIGFIVLDLAFLITGSQFWKKANHIKPASEKNKFLFWLWNNMGVVVGVICFLPFIILLLKDKNTDKKTKAIVVVIAIIALLIGGVSSYDWNPVSEEQLAAAETALGDEQVYWAPFGKVYHTHEDCQALNQTDTLTVGTVDQAIAANRTRLCSFCARQDDITGVATDDTVTADAAG